MALRYLVRRPRAEDLSDIQSQVQNLSDKLGTPDEDLKRMVSVPINNMRSVVFHFLTRKTETGWLWVCPTMELVAEDEKGIFSLVDQYHIASPSHLRHLQ